MLAVDADMARLYVLDVTTRSEDLGQVICCCEEFLYYIKPPAPPAACVTAGMPYS